MYYVRPGSLDESVERANGPAGVDGQAQLFCERGDCHERPCAVAVGLWLLSHDLADREVR